ncbi:MAG: putative transcriptional regulator with cupin domain [Deltaproteobacteria bacterium]|jgi:quercetin dioxygenase-like cupin family protein|nr:putative transcriptional regulator with cupin domain [Deltaproteobacteria bacterium]
MKKVGTKKAASKKKKIQETHHRLEEGYDLLTDSSRLHHPPAGGGHPPKKENLGDRIRKAREMRGLTVKDLSSRTGIREEILLRVETNEIIPPLGELIKIGKAVEMKMGFFISPGAEQPMTVVRREARPVISRYGKKASEQYGYSYESLAPEKGNRFMEPFLVTLMPTSAQELSTHDGQEFIFVLEGEMRAQVGQQVEILRAGDAIYYDSTHPHLVNCAGDRPTKILAVLYTGNK